MTRGANHCRGRVNKFNILKQSKDYDEQGDYCRLWCPELANVPAPKVHTPWQLSQQERVEYKLEVVPYPQARGCSEGASSGNVYPTPIKENSPGPKGGGYGGDKEGSWKGGNVKKRWDNIGDRWTGEKVRGRGGGGGGGNRGKGRGTANAKRQDFMAAHMGLDHN